MLQDPTDYVILHTSNSGNTVYACTLENALKLVNDVASGYSAMNDFYPAYLDQAKGPVLRPASWLLGALKELATKPVGEPMPQLRTVLYGEAVGADDDFRPEVFAKKDWQKEFAFWCFENNINPKEPPTLANALMALRPLETLSFMAPAAARLQKGVTLLSNDYMDALSELHVLRTRQWPDTEPAISVVDRHLRFLNFWSSGNWALSQLIRTIDDDSHA